MFRIDYVQNTMTEFKMYLYVHARVSACGKKARRSAGATVAAEVKVSVSNRARTWHSRQTSALPATAWPACGIQE